MKALSKVLGKASGIALTSIVLMTLIVLTKPVLAQDDSVLAVAQDLVTQRSLDIFNAFIPHHDASYFAEGAVFHDMTLPEPFVGRQAIGAMFEGIYTTAFPDAAPEIQRLTAVGSRVIMEFVFRGTNTGSFFGTPPTGEAIAVPMIAVYDIQDGAIQEAWLYYDAADYARQIGWTR